MNSIKVIILLLALGLQSCFLFEKDPPVVPPDPEETTSFVSSPDEYPITVGKIDEASGMVASRTISDAIWVQQDGNTQPAIHLLSNKGEYKGNISLPFPNRDWEDLAFGIDPISKENYLYIGEIGDNSAVYPDYAIFRFKEPTSLNSSIEGVEKFSFEYIGGDKNQYDAESMFVEPSSGDIYIITKRELNVNVFKIAYPQSTSTMNKAQFLGTIPYPLIQGGDISEDGMEILLKNQFSVYYWKLKPDESIFAAMSRSRDLSPSYQEEPQGEAIAFNKDQSGFFTLSERPDGVSQVSLRYYGKLKSD